jgi:hypothetical protein
MILQTKLLGLLPTNLGALGAQVGYGNTALSSTVLPGAGTTSTFDGYLKGIITGVSTDSTNWKCSTIDVKIVSRVSSAGTETSITYAQGNSANASFELAIHCIS